MSAPVVGGARPATAAALQRPAAVNNNTAKMDSSDYAAAQQGCDEVILATAGYDHTVKFWQAHTGQCVRTIQHADSQVNALEVSPDGQLLAACGYQHIRMYDVLGGSANAVVNYEGVSKNVMDVGFQEQGRWIFTGGEDGTAKIWDPRARNLQCQRVYNAGSAVNSVKLLPNQMELIIGDQNGHIHLWNLRSDRGEQFQPQPDTSIQCVAVDPAGKRGAAVTNKGTAHCWDLVTPPPASSPVAAADGDNANATPPAPANSSSSSAARATAFGAPGSRIAAHKRYALKCKFSPDSSLLATSSADHTAKVWRAGDLELVTELHHEKQRWVWDVAFSGDSQYLFTASSDHVARLWSLPDRQVKREYLGHQKALTCLAFRDGQVA